MTLNKEVHQDVRRPGRSKDAPFTGTGDTEVLSQREANGWMALAWKSNLAGCRVRPKAEAVAAIGTAALFPYRVLTLVAKRGFKRPAPLVVPAFFIGWCVRKLNLAFSIAVFWRVQV